VAPDPLSPLHPAQVPPAVSHSGVFPVHWETLPAEHWPQVPEAWQAGLEVEGQARAAPEPLSPLQPAQVPAAVSHSGVFPAHWEALPAEHWVHAPEAWHAGLEVDGQARVAPEPLSPLHPAQVPLAMSHRGVVPVHWEALPAEHWVHTPEPWQAGLEVDGQARVAPEPLSPLHPAQVPLAMSQSGVFPVHWVKLLAEH
jgi:hypothetical protein